VSKPKLGTHKLLPLLNEQVKEQVKRKRAAALAEEIVNKNQKLVKYQSEKQRKKGAADETQ